MKKKMNKILLVIVFFILISMNFYISEASEASLSANNCTEGETFSVTITMPSDAVGYSGTSIYITYSDGTTSTPKKFSKLNYDFNTNTYSPVGNYTTTFEGKVAGNAIVKVEGLVLTDSKNQQLNSTTSLSATVYIAPKQTTPPVVEPETPTEPENPTTPETPSTGNEGETENNGNNNQDNNTNETTEPKVLTFQDVNETVYVTEGKNVNFRQLYTSEDDKNVIRSLSPGTELLRTGKSTTKGSDGRYWSRVSYEGTTGYIITSRLTTTKPEEPKNEVVENTTVDNTVNEVVNNTITNEVDANELSIITEKIGVLPEVGNNIMINMFFGAVVVSVIMMIIVKKNKYLDDEE